MPSIRRPGRPPEFQGPLGTSLTRVRLRLTRDEWRTLERAASDRGMTFREFLRQRLRKSLLDVLGHEPNKPAAKMLAKQRAVRREKQERPLLAMGGA